MIIVIVIGIVVAVFLGLFISNIISNPIKKIVDAAGKIAEGDLNVNVEVKLRMK